MFYLRNFRVFQGHSILCCGGEGPLEAAILCLLTYLIKGDREERGGIGKPISHSGGESENPILN
jgi:hypothetical protein